MYYDIYYIEPKKKRRKWRKISIKKYVEWFDKTYGCDSIQKSKKTKSKGKNKKKG